MATIVGESTLIKGNLEGDEDLNVHGRIEGAIQLTRTLVVEASGVIKAEVAVRNCIVSGVVVGNITATDSVELTETARVVGDLTAPRVILVDGAMFRGRIDMGDLEIERPAAVEAAPRAAARTLAAPRAAARPAATQRTPLPAPPPRAQPARAPAPAQAAAKKAPAKKAPTKAPAQPPRASSSKKKVKVTRKR